MNNAVDIKTFGATGNGIADDSSAIQKALNSGKHDIYIPKGEYRIKSILNVPSHTHIIADKEARIFSCEEVVKHRGDFLLSNSDTIYGNEDISIFGGIWDGNFDGKNNNKPEDIFCEDAWSGTVLNFVNVKGLTLSDLIVANSVVYHIRMSIIEDFTIKNIGFSSKKLSFNQDGLHFGGCVKNGYVENIKALTRGQTNDDLIALNADDSLKRLENFDLVCGDIENIIFKNIWAEDCYTAIRMLSVTSAIRNIKFQNVYAGCRHFAINMDGARYCRTPLFQGKDYPNGVGNIDNIDIDNMKVFTTQKCNEKAMILCESNVENFRITNFERIAEKDVDFSTLTFKAENVMNLSVETAIEGKTANVHAENCSDVICINDNFTELRLNCN